MKPKIKSQELLGVTRSMAKMHEYNVPKDDHIKIARNPSRLFVLSIGILGDLASAICRKIDILKVQEIKNNLRFSAYFFDAYHSSHPNSEYDPYLLLLGSAAYYLCELPGSSSVLANLLEDGCQDLDADGLEQIILWLLRGNFSHEPNFTSTKYSSVIENLIIALKSVYFNGESTDQLQPHIDAFRTSAYQYGEPRELLFADIICALSIERIRNSVWGSIPYYSLTNLAEWSSVFHKKSFIRELWPAQHLLGTRGIFAGKSGVIQMPTSAGKTKSIEIALRSAFLSDRARTAVIVAPFRALCHEISRDLSTSFDGENIKVDELSDVLQVDFGLFGTTNTYQVIVVTPEKLLYILRQSPDLAKNIGLLIYDEGHQFDSGSRGVTYELLLTSLRRMIPQTTQSILVSAVISNAEAINNWLNGGESVVVTGTNLTPTYRSIGFTSWTESLGRVYFEDPNDSKSYKYFVPRIIKSILLPKKGKETKERRFPEREDGKSVALYLGMNLVKNGSVAVFCGQKLTVTGMQESIVDLFSREPKFPTPAIYSNPQELERLSFLHSQNLGPDSNATKCANLGIFGHHGNTPHGIRLAVEYAMRNDAIRFVICTSTLAQGVNLPIRYLIVTSIYQGGDRIKVRDFHNLIGRAGRSGMHTEGSILFADPEIYDDINKSATKSKWSQIKNLLEPNNSEPCASMLLSLLEPLHSHIGEFSQNIDHLDFATKYIENPEDLFELVEDARAAWPGWAFSRDRVEYQIMEKFDTLAAIESFLLANTPKDEDIEKAVEELVESTLAYSLANDSQRQALHDVFIILTDRISAIESSKRPLYAKTLLSVNDTLYIENWVKDNIYLLRAANDYEEMIDLTWDLISRYINNKTFRSCTRPDLLIELTKAWIDGQPFHKLFEFAKENDFKFGDSKPRKVRTEHIIEMTENGLAYDGSLLIGTIAEMYQQLEPNETMVTDILRNLQKQIKYGLPGVTAIRIFEKGLADRVIAQEIEAIIGEAGSNRSIKAALRRNLTKVMSILDKYPSYFTLALSNALR